MPSTPEQASRRALISWANEKYSTIIHVRFLYTLLIDLRYFSLTLQSPTTKFRSEEVFQYSPLAL